MFNLIFPFYSLRKLQHSNTCGPNAEFICKNVNIDGHNFGMLIITDWISPIKKEVLDSIESVYGPIIVSIGASYHALAYLEITIDTQIFYIAIETTICEPYKLQYYIGNTHEELAQILQVRYQCNGFKISFDCNKQWWDIAYSGGKCLRKNTYKYKRVKRIKRRTYKNKKIYLNSKKGKKSKKSKKNKINK
jgi:hypothetical protein